MQKPEFGLRGGFLSLARLTLVSRVCLARNAGAWKPFQVFQGKAAVPRVLTPYTARTLPNDWSQSSLTPPQEKAQRLLASSPRLPPRGPAWAVRVAGGGGRRGAHLLSVAGRVRQHGGHVEHELVVFVRRVEGVSPCGVSCRQRWTTKTSQRRQNQRLNT